ncbi:Tetratricopeptide repeat-containing protein [Prosthecobacter debontii]|uniref:Tetratricopeptide repeat-containing protein n=1 Tax=Prosthecobacter debontii TaxID=48467 RepID=A0A1T4YU54_9BACT|nr:caspase family protein [Prosthecobacter debontii]SKB04765.1 Tetratricopeptide repeat-containing protein [Prosthecobacter debontii]
MTRLLFGLLLGTACLLSAESPLRTALVIGNARYDQQAGPLRNTVNDSKAVAKALQELGFTVIEKHDLKRDDLLKAMLSFRQTLSEAEVALFYYAGHGIEVSGANYLIPLKSGYSPEGADDVTLRMLAETRLFNVEQAVADMCSGGARCNLIILDACRTTALARTGRTRDANDRGGLVEMKPPAGSLIAFATDAGQTALDGEGAHGLYTEELLRHMKIPGLTIEQVFKRTRAAVLERSEGGQIPAEYSRLIGEDIYLAGQALASEAPSPPMVKAEPVEPPTLAQIMQLATNRMTEECLDALESLAETKGPGDYAEAPLALVLDQVKDDLKDAKEPSEKIDEAATTCAHLLRILPACLPPNHERYKSIAAKAHNRHGDALIILDQSQEAIASLDAAFALTPEDAYILYNRGRAYAILGQIEAARADFEAASDLKLNQPKARQLAQSALKELK